MYGVDWLRDVMLFTPTAQEIARIWVWRLYVLMQIQGFKHQPLFPVMQVNPLALAQRVYKLQGWVVNED